MPAPNNKMNRETLKALVRVKLDEGIPHRTIAKELGISTHTIHRWKQEDVAPADLEAAKKAILASDYENVSKATYIKGKMLDELIRRTDEDELKEIPLQILSRAGVDTAKIYGITTDKILLKEGGITHAPNNVTFEGMMAMLLAKGQADRDAADRIREERKAFEVMKAEGHMKDVTPSH